jgi:DNA-binding response OmpR family regulator
MVTALDPMRERVNGIEADADDFLSKPINQPELLARVRSLLRPSAVRVATLTASPVFGRGPVPSTRST